MPHRMAPLTLKCHMMPMSSRPTRASTTSGLLILPRSTRVDSLPTTTPAPFRPTMEMNRPIPAVMPNFRFAGMEFTRVSRNLKRDRTMKIRPSTRMAVRATFQLTPMPRQTV